MFTLWREGHVGSCLRMEGCICPRLQFLITVILAIVAAGIAGAIGYQSSMALFSEMPHGVMDGLADFLGFFLLLHHGDEHKASEGKWHYLQSLFLFFAATWIGYELYERLSTGEYPISGFYALLGSSVGLGITYIRLGFVRTDGPVSKIRNGIIKHIEADILHMKVAMSLSVILAILGAFNALRSAVWFDAAGTTFLVLRMYWISYQIARGFGCGHDHSHEGHHDDSFDHHH
jgi:divalent metal cation (Fe/Co/Zn/Cd) transporter